MQRCIELALVGAGNVAPNPLVGAVIVCNDEVIGEGFHSEYGGPHAEVVAVHSVVDKSLLDKSTIYVNLEPCAHFGKTPPCCDMIIGHRFKRVVAGMTDPNPLVAGKGLSRIRQAGIETAMGVLEKDCRELNRRFTIWHEKKRPYVILKWAKSSEGFMDIDRSDGHGGMIEITGKESKKMNHLWRHEEAAIMVGWKTVRNDNPRLTCREVTGNSPVRIILDPRGNLDYSEFHVSDGSVRTLIITDSNSSFPGMESVRPDAFHPGRILGELYEKHLQSVIVEGGRTTLDHFIQSELWDEARILTGTRSISTGVRAPQISGRVVQTLAVGKDHVEILRND